MDLKQTFELISGAKVASECFKKSRSWLHQRVNGDLVHGKPVELTPDQRKQLAEYLDSKAQEIMTAANFLRNGE